MIPNFATVGRKSILTPESAATPFSAGPILITERITELDGLRGFALLGVCIANLFSFAGYFMLSPEAQAALPTGGVDGAVLFATHVLVDGKFYTLFSLLFGIGFAVQLHRAAIRGDAFTTRFRRRLLVLLGIGLVHLVFIWIGDILALYAMCGFMLLAFRNRADRTLLIWAAVLIAMPVLQYAAMWALYDPENVAAMALANPGIVLFEVSDSLGQFFGLDGWNGFWAGGWREVWLTNFMAVPWRYGDLFWSGRFFKVFGIFLLGLWAGRRLMAGTLLGDTLLLRRIVVWGFIIGLPANLALGYLMGGMGEYPPSLSGFAERLSYAIGVVPLALAYAAGFILLWRQVDWRYLLGLAAPVGRMALSNYLAQTLLGIGIFYGIGLGWGLQVGPITYTTVGLFLFAGQFAVSTWWLRRFRYGPMEWLWRRLSYGQALAMRVRRPATSPQS